MTDAASIAAGPTPAPARPSGRAHLSPRAVYEQAWQPIVPSNTPPGDYGLQIAYSPGYPPQYGAWTGMGEVQVLHVKRRPLPASGL